MQRPYLSYTAFDILSELLEVESALRHIDEVGPVVVVLAAQGGGRGQKAGVAAHDNGHIDARQRPVVEVGAGEGRARRSGPPSG